ncbi:hypothetical protein GCM10023196_046740 [Actinoallomurus vinaceus]|uniref:Uncharacterized protein n=1 Tax=Actinoallomurus vinaceus TaxID=1080074 RepID=A0ABP8UDG1_9ACTN
MDEVLRQALEPVLRDIRATGAPEPDVRDDGWADDDLSASAFLWSRDGSAVGIRVDRAAAEADRVVQVADQVQEWVIEELWGQAATNWPRCPGHPATHPLRASTRARSAMWVCPSEGTPISPIGSLE